MKTKFLNLDYDADFAGMPQSDSEDEPLEWICAKLFVEELFQCGSGTKHILSFEQPPPEPLRESCMIYHAGARAVLDVILGSFLGHSESVIQASIERGYQHNGPPRLPVSKQRTRYSRLT